MCDYFFKAQEKLTNQQFYQETFLSLVKTAQEKLDMSTQVLQQELEKFQHQVCGCLFIPAAIYS